MRLHLTILSLKTGRFARVHFQAAFYSAIAASRKRVAGARPSGCATLSPGAPDLDRRRASAAFGVKGLKRDPSERRIREGRLLRAPLWDPQIAQNGARTLTRFGLYLEGY